MVTACTTSCISDKQYPKDGVHSKLRRITLPRTRVNGGPRLYAPALPATVAQSTLFFSSLGATLHLEGPVVAGAREVASRG
jgi:hypothetical protein